VQAPVVFTGGNISGQKLDVCMSVKKQQNSGVIMVNIQAHLFNQ